MQLLSMTHLVLMKTLGKEPKHAEMYTQMYHFVRIVAIFPVFVQIEGFHTSFYLYFSDTSSCFLKALSCLFDW